MKIVQYTIALSLLLVSANHAKSIKEEMTSLETQTLELRQQFRELRTNLASLYALFSKLEPFIKKEQEEAAQLKFEELIQFIAEQYDADKPESNFLTLLIEKLSFGIYTRPKGSLTNEGFNVLYGLTEEASKKELQWSLRITRDLIKQADGDRLRALTIIRSYLNFALDKLNEDS